MLHMLPYIHAMNAPVTTRTKENIWT